MPTLLRKDVQKNFSKEFDARKIYFFAIFVKQKSARKILVCRKMVLKILKYGKFKQICFFYARFWKIEIWDNYQFTFGKGLPF